MSQESLVFFLGFCTLLTPLLGIPSEWKEWTALVLGGLLIVLGYRLRRARYIRSLETTKGERRSEAFVESHAPRTSGVVPD